MNGRSSQDNTQWNLVPMEHGGKSTLDELEWP